MGSDVLGPFLVGSYEVDTVHSHIGFEVKHLAIATVRGAFTRYAVTLNALESGVTAAGTIEAASVDTGVSDRDDDLRSAHFFDVDRFPRISFSTSDVRFDGNHHVVAHGELTIKDVTKTIELDGDVGDVGEDPWGDQRVGLDLKGVIDRRDFHLLGGNSVTNSDLVVGTSVKLVLTVSAVRQVD